MRQYTLNDLKFNPEPITLFEPDPNYKPDKEALEESAKKNKELIKRFQEECKELLGNV